MEIFGIFGLVLVGAALLWMRDQASNKACTACRKRVDRKATKCPFCQSELGKA